MFTLLVLYERVRILVGSDSSELGSDMSLQSLDIGEEAISNLVKTVISSQLDTYDALDVEVRTDPLNLTQGKIDSLIVKGQGLVVQNDLRTESLALETSAVDISMMKMMTGEVALDEPAAATTEVSLKPADVQAAFNGQFVKSKMRGTKVTLASGEEVTTDFSNITFTIPEAGRIAVSADVMLMEKVETHHVEFSAAPQLIEDGYGVVLEDVRYRDENNDMPALTQLLIDTTQDLLDFRSFDLGKMTLQFTKIDVLPDQMLLKANATIESFS